MATLRTLRKGEQFDQAYRKGTVIRGSLFLLRVSKNDRNGPRWGFAVGKRLAKGAVTRNRLRRRFREAARSVGFEGSYDVIMIARADALTAPFSRIVSELQKQLRHLPAVQDGTE